MEVEVDGNVYEVGKLYVDMTSLRVVCFVGVTGDGFDLKIRTLDGCTGCTNRLSEISPEQLGIITKAQIKPEVGCVYKVGLEGINRKFYDVYTGNGWADYEGEEVNIICKMVEET